MHRLNRELRLADKAFVEREERISGGRGSAKVLVLGLVGLVVLGASALFFLSDVGRGIFESEYDRGQRERERIREQREQLERRWCDEGVKKWGCEEQAR